MSLHTAHVRTSVIAVAVAGSLLALPACSSSKTSNSINGGQAAATATSSADRVKLAKTKFVANAALASGAFYQWIYKPFKAGTFKSGAKGRTAALIKGGLAGAFTYNRLKAALNDAKGDPTLSKATDALSSAVDGIKNLPSKIKGGNATDADMNQVTGVIDGVKKAGAANGLNIQDQVPNASQLTQMVNS
ncbi:hypothetical protein ABIA32_000709 [Streptacidiphilus sp. MAP12-20]|uniref:hypothetical protein n=1 Tax=Streptacidiphilus sp. MAP12-20 TaxID=3156299 RepID=UPI0035110BC6